MAENSKIEWTDATWNPITGCTVVSPGCTNCYAMKLAGTRLQHHPSRAGLTTDSKGGPVWNGQVRFNEEWLAQPLRWKRPRMIFVCAHGDLFHESVPDEWIDRVFAVMALAPQHTFQVLTKRSGRMREYFCCVNDARNAICEAGRKWQNSLGFDGDITHSAIWDAGWALPNVWLGVSVEDQKRAEERILNLLATPAAVRFVSAEPLLGPMDISDFMWPVHHWWESGKGYRSYEEAKAAGGKCGHKRQSLVGAWCKFLDWVIVGGESGPGARPIHPDWARSIRDQCEAAGVPFFFKQWVEWAWPEDYRPDGVEWRRFPGNFSDPAKVHIFADGLNVARVGKKAAGRLLDGIEHNGMPKIGGAS